MSSQDSNPIERDEEDSSVLDFFLTLARRKKLVLGLPATASVLALLISFALPNWYTAGTKIMPPQQSQTNAVAILGQLGALAGGGASQALGLKNPSDVYVSMLKSRTVADALLQRFDLLHLYGEDLMLDARRELAHNTSIVAGREGIITIEVDDKDPKRAADMAAAYVEELRNRTLNLAVGEASQRRLFFEGQLKKARNDLTLAEMELKKFSESAGLMNPQGQLSLTVAAAASLRAQITAKEIQLAAMRSFATESNPDMKRIMQEVLGLRSELAKLEKDPTVTKGDVMMPFGKAPGVALEYGRRFRDMKYHETLFEVLARQYEIARIDEAKDATLIQVLDASVVPEKKSRPKRVIIALLAGLLAFIVAVATALILDALKRSSLDSRRSTRIAELASLLGWKKTGAP
jgi:uncharacterized protein involved in exopolysaccharide biosynthesis